ncbi:MAG: immunoglobulin-like domain-containing protein, partial [Clostridia bacterium]|nr:immunoglobulin-like domain-containing protein [Clostridia bacterium]
NNTVFSFKYDIRIPEDSPVTEERFLEMQIGSAYRKTGSSKASLINDNKLFVKVTDKIKATVAKSANFSTYILANSGNGIDFNKNEWYTVEFRVAIVSGKQVWGVYVTDSNDKTTQLMYAETKNSYSSIALGQFLFNETDPTSDPLVTHYDNMACLTRDTSYYAPVEEKPGVDNQSIVESDIAALSPSATGLITGTKVSMPATGGSGLTTISWTSTNEDLIALDGTVNHLDLQYDTEVTLKATATLEDATATKSFTYTVQAEQIKNFIEYTFDNLADDYTATAFYDTEDKNGNPIIAATEFGKNTGIDTDYFKFGSATVAAFKESATVTSNCEGITNKSGNSLYIHTNGDVETSEAAYLISNSNYGIASHISDTNETVLVAGYDMYIPEETKASLRKGCLRLHLGGEASAYDFFISTEIQNGVLVFKINESEIYNTVVPLTYANNKVEVPSDEWFTVQYVIKINPDASGVHSMKVYGIVDGVCYCEEELTLTSLNILINKMDFYICGTGTGMDNITTGFDNLHVTKIPFYTNDFTDGIPANYIYPLNVGYDATAGTITASGRVRNASGNHCLVLAVYDDTGRLQTIKPVDTMDGEGKMYATLTNASDYLVNNYKYKAFMFETLSSLIPQVNAQEVTYSAE